METYYWNSWYAGFGWFLWAGVVFLMFSSVGNWGYTYQAHRNYKSGYPQKDALSILNERYARGEINQAEYLQIKSYIVKDLLIGSPDPIRKHA